MADSDPDEHWGGWKPIKAQAAEHEVQMKPEDVQDEYEDVDVESDDLRQEFWFDVKTETESESESKEPLHVAGQAPSHAVPPWRVTHQPPRRQPVPVPVQHQPVLWHLPRPRPRPRPIPMQHRPLGRVPPRHVPRHVPQHVPPREPRPVPAQAQPVPVGPVAAARPRPVPICAVKSEEEAHHPIRQHLRQVHRVQPYPVPRASSSRTSDSSHSSQSCHPESESELSSFTTNGLALEMAETLYQLGVVMGHLRSWQKKE